MTCANKPHGFLVPSRDCFPPLTPYVCFISSTVRVRVRAQNVNCHDRYCRPTRDLCLVSDTPLPDESCYTSSANNVSSSCQTHRDLPARRRDSRHVFVSRPRAQMMSSMLIYFTPVAPTKCPCTAASRRNTPASDTTRLQRCEGASSPSVHVVCV